MLTIGPDVQEISSAYDEYWNSDLSFPGTAMSEDASLEEFQSRREDLKEYLNQNKEILASYPPDPLNWEQELLNLPDRNKSSLSLPISYLAIY